MKRFRGFTLIELLVVVAIIGVLIAIIIPSLGRAKESANRTMCMTHLKSQGTAFGLYAASYSDALPVFANTASNWMHDQPTEVGDVLLGMTPGASTAGLGLGALSNVQATQGIRKYYYCPSSLLAADSDRAWYSPSAGTATTWTATDPNSKNRAFGYQYSNDRRGDGTGLGWALPGRAQGAQPLLKWHRKFISEPNGSVAELAWDDITNAGDGDWVKPLQASWITVNTSHLRGKNPQGQNVLCFDNHVEWRNFKLQAATAIGQQGSTSALFYLQNP